MSDYTPQGRPGDEAVRWSHGGGPAPSASVQSTIHQMTDQLQTVIEAAERAAEAIRHDAEEQARRHLAEAQRKADRLTAERVGLISELTDDLIRHAANVRDHSEQMVRALEDAINSVTDKLEQPAMSDPLGAAAPSLPLGARRPGSGPPRSRSRAIRRPTASTPTSSAPRRPPCRHRLRLPSPREPRCRAPRTHPPAHRSRLPTRRRPRRHRCIRAGTAPRSPRLPQRTPGSPTPAEEEPPRSPPWGRLPGTRRARRTPIEPPVAGPPAGDSAPEVPLPGPGTGEQVVSEDAVLHAGRLAAAGETRETIANTLRQVWGVSDPDPIVDRVLNNR